MCSSYCKSVRFFRIFLLTRPAETKNATKMTKQFLTFYSNFFGFHTCGSFLTQIWGILWSVLKNMGSENVWFVFFCSNPNKETIFHVLFRSLWFSYTFGFYSTQIWFLFCTMTAQKDYTKKMYIFSNTCHVFLIKVKYVGR